MGRMGNHGVIKQSKSAQADGRMDGQGDSGQAGGGWTGRGRVDRQEEQ